MVELYRTGKGVKYMIIHSTQELGQIIRTTRKNMGLTQSDLAGACACGVRFISELENGKPSIELGRALRVAHVLGLDLSVDERGAR